MQKEWRHFIQRVDYTSSPARCAFKKASAPWQNERALILRFGMLVSNRWTFGLPHISLGSSESIAMLGRVTLVSLRCTWKTRYSVKTFWWPPVRS